jgi:hypothetical protein
VVAACVCDWLTTTLLDAELPSHTQSCSDPDEESPERRPRPEFYSIGHMAKINGG